VRLGGKPAVLDESVAVEQPQDGLGVPNIDR
jgi:hypothetical protein